MEDTKALRDLAAAIGIFCLPLPLSAAEWTLQDALSLQLIYSDNLTLQGAQRAGFVTQVQPSLNLSGEGRRMQLSFDYKPALVLDPSSDAGGDNARLNQLLDATLSSELYRQTLFLDANATASLSSLSSQGPITTDGVVNNTNQVQTYQLTLNPHSTHRLGGVAVLQNSYSFSSVIAEGSQAADSLSHQVSSSLQNADSSRPLGWSLTASYQLIDYEGQTQDSNTRVDSGLSYRLDADWSFSGVLGYQVADVRSSRSDTQGIDWQLGAVWTPNPRTSLSTNLGAAYYGPHWDVSFTHRSRRTEMALSFSRSLSNARNFVGTETDPTGLNPSLGNEDFVADQLRFNVTLTGRRTTLSSSVGYSSLSYELSGLKDQSLSWDLSASRSLRPNLSAHVDLYLAKLDPNGPADSKLSRVGAGLNRKLGRYSSLDLSLQSQRQTGDAASAYTENRASATFQTKFL